MSNISRVLSFPIKYRDPSGPFAIEVTVAAITLTLGAGTLHDEDKGAFPLEGLELSAHLVNGRVEPIAIRNPGVLTEFQQEGLLDLVSSALHAFDAPAFPSPKE